MGRSKKWRKGQGGTTPRSYRLLVPYLGLRRRRADLINEETTVLGMGKVGVAKNTPTIREK